MRVVAIAALLAAVVASSGCESECEGLPSCNEGCGNHCVRISCCQDGRVQTLYCDCLDVDAFTPGGADAGPAAPVAR
jgi:hypothetical protein